MSYILQALKKEEADSDPQAAARLALAEQTTARPWALWGIGLALLVNAGVLGYLFFPSTLTGPSIAGNPPPAGTADAQAAAPPPAIPTPTQIETPIETPTLGPATVPTAGARGEVTVRPRSRVAPPGQAPPSPRPLPSVAQRSAQSAAPGAIAPTVELAATTGEITIGPNSPPARPERGGGRVLSPAEAEALDLIPAGRTPAPTRPADPNPAAPPTPAPGPAPAPTGREQPRVIQLAELPPADRQSFPKLEFSTHIFADDPALRAVVVNSKRLNEGESIGEMVLRAVTEDGILVDYRGYRVAVSVIEEWN